MSEVIRFNQLNQPFVGLTGRVDFNEAKIHGVSLITSQIEATGHGLFVDDICLNQLHQFGKEMGQVPVTQDHEGGVADGNGYIENIRLDGKQLRGDWCLLKSHPDTVTMLERADRQPRTFGLSLAFKGNPEGTLYMGKKCARAEALLSADVVKRPAANPMGLFSAKDNANVDSRQKGARKTIELQNTMPTEPTLQEVLAELQSVRGELAQQQEITEQLVDHANQSVTGAEQSGEVDPAFLSALNDASDEELAAYNEQNGTDISREDINGAVSEYNAGLSAQQGEEQGEQGQEGDGQYEGSYGGEQGAGEMAGAAAGGEGGGATSFAALQRELIQLKARLNKRDAQEIQFAEKQATNDVRTKISAIVSQRDQLVQFADRVVAENEALRLHVRTGTRPVAAGVDAGIRLFHSGNDELHPFQQRVLAFKAEKKCSDGQAITFAIKEPNGSALHADWLQSNSGHTIRA